MIKDSNALKSNINIINSLCNSLDFLASPNVEKEIACSLDCCADTFVSGNIKTLVAYSDETQFIVGDAGLKMLQQLDKAWGDICGCDGEKGFSNTQRWLDFVDYINMVNTFLKDAVKRHTEKTLG